MLQDRLTRSQHAPKQIHLRTRVPLKWLNMEPKKSISSQKAIGTCAIVSSVVSVAVAAAEAVAVAVAEALAVAVAAAVAVAVAVAVSYVYIYGNHRGQA